MIVDSDSFSEPFLGADNPSLLSQFIVPLTDSDQVIDSDFKLTGVPDSRGQPKSEYRMQPAMRLRAEAWARVGDHWQHRTCGLDCHPAHLLLLSVLFPVPVRPRRNPPGADARHSWAPTPHAPIMLELNLGASWRAYELPLRLPWLRWPGAEIWRRQRGPSPQIRRSTGGQGAMMHFFCPQKFHFLPTVNFLPSFSQR